MDESAVERESVGVTPQRWSRIRELFGAALETPESERQRFLESACGGDFDLQSEVERLLAGNEEPSWQSPATTLFQAAIELAPGDALAQYRIEAKLGEGGMGVVYKAYDSRLHRAVALKVLPPDHIVYRARDTKLNRDIAVKVLPVAFTNDPERKRRFVREAQAASALNHPNIITIYDIDTSAGVDFIAMEYVSGRTLDRLIPRQGMRTAEVLRYAVQMADALAAAHAVGIIHRDLKPGNVMVTESSLVKVLDFGLAKLTKKAGPDEATETIGARPTEEGQILGTIAYMSPEQAQGLKLDARSDIFSFGAVLYEMLTGRRAFSGDTNMSTLAAILNREPQPLAATTPRELDRIVTRCLRKDVARRFQTMADLKVALEELKEESDSGRLGPVEIASVPNRRRWPLGVAAAGIALAAAGGAWLLWNSRGKTISTQANLRQLTHDAADTGLPALSPDGKLVAYHSDRAQPGKYDIWVQQTAGGPAIRLTKEGVNWSPAFSADGSKIYFVCAVKTENICQISALGGEVRLIAADGRSPSVSPDGRSIAYFSSSSGQLYTVSSDGGQPHSAAPGYSRSPGEASRAVWSPDSRYIVFRGHKTGQQTDDWWGVPTMGGTLERTGWNQWSLDRHMTNGDLGAWLPDDVLIFWMTIGDTSRVYRGRFDRKGWRVLGEPESLTFGTAADEFPSVAAGKIAFQSGRPVEGIWSLPADTNQGGVTGSLEKLTTENADYSFARPNHDGRWLAFSSKRTGNFDIFLRDLSTGQERVTVTSSEDKSLPLIAADGSKVLYTVYRGAGFDSAVYEAPTSGGPGRKICDTCGPAVSLSPDGKQFLAEREDGANITLVDVESGRSRVLLQRSPFQIAAPRFSPDGRWVAFLMSRPDSTDVVVAPVRGETIVPNQDWVTIASNNITDDTFWSPNGELIYYSAQTTIGGLSIKAQRLNKNHQPIGSPINVYEFSGRVRPPNTGPFGQNRLTAVPGHIIGTMSEQISNIWIMDLPK